MIELLSELLRSMQVGELIKVEKDYYFPADLLLISSTNDDGIAYVETMNLDGETNLKIKKALDQTKGITELNVKDFKVRRQSSHSSARSRTHSGATVL